MKYTKITIHMNSQPVFVMRLFLNTLMKRGVDCVVAISSILRLKLRHDLQLTEYDVKNMDKVLSLFGQMDMKNILKESEYEYLEEDILILEYKYKEFK